ncbi:putative metal-binding protein [Novosphingobium fluoreni]|uniref:Putative metal-binding protein n=1 Tax=Novosphingobium fluoreni TaxID=1391222 RepID=A0A7W6BZ86_9SPHN|nr:DUF1636 domain-containing protein [Novosphingobium fluoreni]MBB3940624.1 putative metal-binding protein [Novosphingobium fluoreni]
MLKSAGSGPAVVVCNTCRHSATEREDADGRRGGTRLADALQHIRATEPQYQGVEVQQMPCLFACKDFCTIHLRAPGKVGYVLGRFAPNEEAARAILDYAVRYADSAHGQVPYKQWPDGVKGHFITRTPPEGYLVE